MAYRVSSITFFIFLIGIVILWQQGLRLYPYSFGDEDVSKVIPPQEGAIQLPSARKLKALRLDFSIFEDPLYKSLRLREITVSELSSIPHGRKDPFAKVKEGGTGNAATGNAAVR